MCHVANFYSDDVWHTLYKVSQSENGTNVESLDLDLLNFQFSNSKSLRQAWAKASFGHGQIFCMAGCLQKFCRATSHIYKVNIWYVHLE